MSFTDRSLGCFLIQFPAGCQGKIANRNSTSIFLPPNPAGDSGSVPVIDKPGGKWFTQKSVKLQFTLYTHSKTRTAPDNA
jgi:hypothetical protein